MRKLGMSVEIEIGSLRDAFEFAPAPWKLEFDIAGAGRIMRKFVCIMRTNPQHF